MQVQSQDVTCHFFASLLWSDDRSRRRKHAYSVYYGVAWWPLQFCFFQRTGSLLINKFMISYWIELVSWLNKYVDLRLFIRSATTEYVLQSLRIHCMIRAQAWVSWNDPIQSTEHKGILRSVLHIYGLCFNQDEMRCYDSNHHMHHGTPALLN